MSKNQERANQKASDNLFFANLNSGVFLSPP